MQSISPSSTQVATSHLPSPTVSTSSGISSSPVSSQGGTQSSSPINFESTNSESPSSSQEASSSGSPSTSPSETVEVLSPSNTPMPPRESSSGSSGQGTVIGLAASLPTAFILALGAFAFWKLKNRQQKKITELELTALELFKNSEFASYITDEDPQIGAGNVLVFKNEIDIIILYKVANDQWKYQHIIKRQSFIPLSSLDGFSNIVGDLNALNTISDIKDINNNNLKNNLFNLVLSQLSIQNNNPNNLRSEVFENQKMIVMFLGNLFICLFQDPAWRFQVYQRQSKDFLLNRPYCDQEIVTRLSAALHHGHVSDLKEQIISLFTETQQPTGINALTEFERDMIIPHLVYIRTPDIPEIELLNRNRRSTVALLSTRGGDEEEAKTDRVIVLGEYNHVIPVIFEQGKKWYYQFIVKHNPITFLRDMPDSQAIINELDRMSEENFNNQILLNWAVRQQVFNQSIVDSFTTKKFQDKPLFLMGIEHLTVGFFKQEDAWCLQLYDLRMKGLLSRWPGMLNEIERLNKLSPQESITLGTQTRLLELFLQSDRVNEISSENQKSITEQIANFFVTSMSQLQDQNNQVPAPEHITFIGKRHDTLLVLFQLDGTWQYLLLVDHQNNICLNDIPETQALVNGLGTDDGALEDLDLSRLYDPVFRRFSLRAGKINNTNTHYPNENTLLIRKGKTIIYIVRKLVDHQPTSWFCGSCNIQSNAKLFRWPTDMTPELLNEDINNDVKTRLLDLLIPPYIPRFVITLLDDARDNPRPFVVGEKDNKILILYKHNGNESWRYQLIFDYRDCAALSSCDNASTVIEQLTQWNFENDLEGELKNNLLALVFPKLSFPIQNIGTLQVQSHDTHKAIIIPYGNTNIFVFQQPNKCWYYRTYNKLMNDLLQNIPNLPEHLMHQLNTLPALETMNPKLQAELLKYTMPDKPQSLSSENEQTTRCCPYPFHRSLIQV